MTRQFFIIFFTPIAKEVKRMALEAAAPHTAGKTVVKVIVVPGRLVSIVVK